MLQDSFCACDDRTVLIVAFLVISHASALLTVPVMFALSLKVSVAGIRADGDDVARCTRAWGKVTLG